MSSFKCDKCGKYILDSESGYTTGCEHYPLYKPVIKVCNPEEAMNMPEPEDIRKMRDKQDSPIVEAIKEGRIDVTNKRGIMFWSKTLGIWVVITKEREALYSGDSLEAAVKALKEAKR